MENRDFKGVWIPKEIYLDKNLNWTDKILLIEIDSLDVGNNHCFASNEYFSGFLGVSKQSVSASINKLKKLGYIEEINFDGRKRTLKSNIKPALKQTLRETSTKLEGSIKENLMHNNIYNNISNNIENIIEKKEKEKKENISSYNSEELKEKEITIKEYKDYKKEDILDRECIIDTYYKWREKQKYTFDIDKFADYYDGKIKKKDLFMTFRIWQSKVETQAEELENQYKKLMLGNIILNNKWEE